MKVAILLLILPIALEGFTMPAKTPRVPVPKTTRRENTSSHSQTQSGRREQPNLARVHFKLSRSPDDNDDRDKIAPKVWERFSIDFEADDTRKIAVDFLTIFATTLYVKLFDITASISFPGWDAVPTIDTLPETTTRVCVFCFSWVVANLRENGFSGDVESTRLVKFGQKTPKKVSDKLMLVTLQTANTWLAFSVLVALISSVIGAGQEEMAKVVATLLPVMCVERAALFLSDK